MAEFFTLDVLKSGLVILLFMELGSMLSAKTRGTIPAILVAGVLYMVCCWAGILPPGLPELAGFKALGSVPVMIILVHMGTLTELKDLLANWRVVAFAACTFVCQLGALFLVMTTLFDFNTFLGGLPGGTATAHIIQEQARALGYDHLIILSALLLATQSLAACPVAAWFTREEAARLRALPRPQATPSPEQTDAASAAKEGSVFQYRSLLKLYAVVCLAEGVEHLTGVSRYVLCMLLGVILAQVGVLRRDELARSKSEGFLFFLILAAMLSSFAVATPEMFAQMLLPLATVLICNLVSTSCFSLLFARVFGFSPYLAIAMGVNVMIGFPVNMMMTEEITANLSDNPEEQAWLAGEIAPRIVIAGLTNLTSLATLTVGLLVPLMH